MLLFFYYVGISPRDISRITTKAPYEVTLMGERHMHIEISDFVMRTFVPRSKRMAINLCFIKEKYFMQHSSFTNMLDPGNLSKQNHRTHLCLVVESDANKFYIPLRNNLGAEVRKFGRIGHAVPSKNRPSAGLDYRYALIINDDTLIEEQTEQRIPNMQYQKIEAEYESIKREFDTYLRGFKRAMIKNRIQKEPLYRISSLINFLDELKA